MTATVNHGTLLVVDDDEMNRDALSRKLSRTGYTVLTAQGGADALEMIGKHHIDAVLLDVMMPGMSGIDTLRSLRKTRSVSDLPVIMVTAKDASGDVVEALDLGANDYVTKPIDYAVALARIRAQVTARRADPLTGLPNKVLFAQRLNRLLERRSSDPQGFAVLFLDVDRFKAINDSLGHSAGDELLTEIARRLEHALRLGDTVVRVKADHTLARVGGDEFTILLDGVTDDGASAVAERLRAVVAEPFHIQGRPVVTSVSIGVVMSADRYHRAEDMIRDADTAMYRAKDLGKARCEIFDTSMLAAAERRRQLETDLREALNRREFEVYYQPIVSLAGGRLSGFEALLRWHHPQHGLVGPDEFIPIADDTGLIVPIGRWVLGEACRQLRAWDVEFPDSRLTMNVNVSARQCLDRSLLDDIAQILAETGCQPDRVKLEITESAVLEHSETVLQILHDIRRLGVHLGLDDFGTGYSSLSYLQRYPFQTIKIDRAFISGMRDSGNTEIIKAIIAMAAGLDMDVTAEGVETAEQLQGLQELSCEFGQGFFFQRPVTAADARALLCSSVALPENAK